MSYPTGSIPVTGLLGTTASTDTYPVTTDELNFGGMRSVADNTARDAITTGRRKFGMLAFSVGSNATYILANVAMGGASNTLSDNSNWIAYSTGSSGITALTGDVTASGAGSVAAIIPAGTVTNAKQANMAAHTFKGNNTGSPGAPMDLSIAQMQAELNLAGTNSGDITIGAFSNSPSATGVFLAGQQLTMAAADSSSPGMVSTGNQSWQGEKIFLNPPRISVIKNISGTQIWDTSTSSANDQSGARSADFNSRYFVASNNTASVDYENGILVDKNTSITSLNWFLRQFSDAANVLSVDWDARIFYDSGAADSIRYNARTLVNSGIETLHWDSGQLYDMSNIFSLDWMNRLLLDASGQARIDWQNGTWADNTGSPSLDVQNRSLLFGGTPVLLWNTSQVQFPFGLLSAMDLVYSAHLVSSGGTPTFNIQPILGVGASVSIVGTDTDGQITITSGTLGLGAGDILDINFVSGNFPTNSFTTLTPANLAAAPLASQVFVTNTTGGWSVNTTVALGVATTYVFNYHVGGN